MARANAEANRFIEEARAAAAQLREQETQKAIAAAEQIMARRARRRSGPHPNARRTQARGGPVGCPDYCGHHRQDSDNGRSATLAEETARELTTTIGRTMMKTTKQIKREAKQLFRCVSSMDRWMKIAFVRCYKDPRIETSWLTWLFWPISAPGETRSIAAYGQGRKRYAVVSGLASERQASLARTYGPEMNTSFAENPAFIGGMRIRVGSDVYDGSVKAGWLHWRRAFERIERLGAVQIDSRRGRIEVATDGKPINGN